MVKVSHQRVFNIVDYGAVQDSTTDCTAAIQAAINDCILARGTLYIPCSTTSFNYYRINSGLNIVGSAFPNDQIWISIVAEGRSGGQIVYHGANNGCALTIIGMRGGSIRGLAVVIANGITGATCFGIGTNSTSTTGDFSFYDCKAGLGNGTGNQGWTVGQISQGGNGDISFLCWYNCEVWGGLNLGITGQYGFHIAGENCLQFSWFGGGVFLCDQGFRVSGGGCMYLFGVGGSQNNVDFQLSYVTVVTINGGRWEASRTFLDLPFAGRPSQVHLTNIDLGGMQPNGSDAIIQTGQGCTLIIDSLTVYKGAGQTYTQPLIRLYADTASIGNFHMRGGAVQTSNANLIQVDVPAKWKVSLKNVGRYNTNLETSTYFTNIET